MNKAVIKTILSWAKKLFVIALIIYLVFFLLEITFPGFISNNFNLNWVLGGVLILGVLAAFAPDEEESPFVKTTGALRKTDYFLFAGLGIIGGLLMFYKSDLNLVPRIIFSVFVAGFITVISLYLLTAKDEEETEENAEPEEAKPMSTLAKKMLGIIAVGVIVLGSGLLIIQSKKKTTESPITNVAQIIEEPLPLKQIPITILNGGAQVGSASAMAKFLQTKNFTIGRVADADNSNYTNALIRFRPEEVKMARYLEEIIQETYPNVDRAPLATDSAEIILILGNLDQ